MSIDWFTIGAQAVNFLVLLWLLKRFLYKPILNAIDTREKRIAAELAGARDDKAEAERQKNENEQTSADLQQTRAAFLKEAQDDARAEKERLLKEAREAAEASREKRDEALKVEAAALKKDVSTRLHDEVIALTRKVLTDLAGERLEEQVMLTFVERLRNLEPSRMEELQSSLESGAEAITLRTAFDVPTGLRTNTESAMTEILGALPEVRYETAPELISGIELRTQGQKIAWSIDDYLSSLAEDFEVLPQEQR